MRNALYIAATSICLNMATAPASANDLQFHWQDSFSPAQQTRLMSWIAQTDAALTSLVGPLPFTRHIYFHRLDNASEPVPWAHTQRSQQQGVHFHVDLRYARTEFLKDWTAPHELSHLALPYLGEDHAWFAEGFASYMQYQVMQEMGALTEAQALERYQSRISRAQQRYNHPNMAFAEAAPHLRASRQYPTMYWGGAVFFLQTEQLLLEQGTSMLEVLKKFIACCRTQTRGINALLARLDELSESQVFTQQWAKFQSIPGFPATEMLPQ